MAATVKNTLASVSFGQPVGISGIVEVAYETVERALGPCQAIRLLVLPSRWLGNSRQTVFRGSLGFPFLILEDKPAGLRGLF